MQYAIEAVKWQAFWASHNDDNFQEATIHIQLMQDAMWSKIGKVHGIIQNFAHNLKGTAKGVSAIFHTLQ